MSTAPRRQGKLTKDLNVGQMTDDALENAAWPKMRVNSAENDAVFKTKLNFQVCKQNLDGLAQLCENK
jgi:hypothetical protein